MESTFLKAFNTHRHYPSFTVCLPRDRCWAESFTHGLRSQALSPFLPKRKTGSGRLRTLCTHTLGPLRTDKYLPSWGKLWAGGCDSLENQGLGEAVTKASWSRRHPNLGSLPLPDVGRAMGHLDHESRNPPSPGSATTWQGEGCQVRARRDLSNSTSSAQHHPQAPCAGCPVCRASCMQG